MKSNDKNPETVSNVNQREIVLDLLLENEKTPGHFNVLIKQALDKYQYLLKPQRAFISRLAEGTLEKQIEEDWLINQVSKTKVCKMKPVIRNILRMSVYQLKYMDNVPVSAVCNEAVRLAAKRGFAPLKGFVNGVLRNLSRSINDIAYPSRDKDFVSYCSVKYSMPEFLVEHFIKECGTQNAEKIMQGFDEDKKLYIRCNRHLITPEELKARLEKENVAVKDTIVPYAFEISGYDYLAGLDSFEDGLFQVQDISSILAGLAVKANKGDFIIDVCASPGGKSLHAAERAEGVTVEARDVSEKKAELIEDNIERMKAFNVRTKVWDATVKDESVKDMADILICDVPCSGLGIIGRKADIRYNITQDKLNSLVELQRQILSASSEYVKPGGFIVYSTCTINRAENLDNVLWFTENFPYELDSIEDDYPMLNQDTLKKGYVQLLPGVDGTDGFFIARLKRKDNGKN